MVVDDDPYFCPDCGDRMTPTYRGMMWHALNRWHNPLASAVNARRAGMPLWEIVVCGLVGTAIAAVLIGGFVFLLSR